MTDHERWRATTATQLYIIATEQENPVSAIADKLESILSEQDAASITEPFLGARPGIPCQTCGGSGEKLAQDPSMEGVPGYALSVIRCPDCKENEDDKV